MTDKQIIIDGVDVSGCEYHSLNKNNCSLCSLSNNLICSYKPFCSYKQLKAKEQECETLASQLDFEVQKKECLEQESKSLKETFDGLFKVQYKLADNNKKLRQCFIEIKEIAERDKEFCIKCNGNKEIDCVECIEGGRALLAKDILQKISEVDDG